MPNINLQKRPNLYRIEYTHHYPDDKRLAHGEVRIAADSCSAAIQIFLASSTAKILELHAERVL